MRLNLPDLLNGYAALQADLELPPMSTAAVSCHSRDVASDDDVRQAIAAFQAAGGWLTCTERNVWLDALYPVVPDAADTGLVLDGELCSADGLRGLQIRHLGGRWRLTTIEHDPHGHSALIDELTLIGKAPAPAELRYRRYWRASDSHVLQPFLALLLPEVR